MVAYLSVCSIRRSHTTACACILTPTVSIHLCDRLDHLMGLLLSIKAYLICNMTCIYLSENPLSADVGQSIKYGGFSDIGRRRLEYQLLENLSVGWGYQLCKSPLSHG